jgi:hypothetical protein
MVGDDRRASVMPRVERKAKNQALFRQVNERIAETSAAMDAGEGQVQAFICECSRIGCRQLVEVPAVLYERVREDPTLFLVLPGHEDHDREEIVERHGDYLIVATKPGQATDIALETATELRVTSEPAGHF